MNYLLEIAVGSLIMGPLLAFTGTLAGLHEIFIPGYIILALGVVLILFYRIRKPDQYQEESWEDQ